MRSLALALVLAVGCASSPDVQPTVDDTPPPAEPAPPATMSVDDVFTLVERYACTAERSTNEGATAIVAECEGDEMFLVVVEGCAPGSQLCSMDNIATMLAEELEAPALQPTKLQLPTAGVLRAYHLHAVEDDDAVDAYFADERLPGDFKLAACAWRKDPTREAICLDFFDRLIAPR
jgi:hypothetical protein